MSYCTAWNKSFFKLAENNIRFLNCKKLIDANTKNSIPSSKALPDLQESNAIDLFIKKFNSFFWML